MNTVRHVHVRLLKVLIVLCLFLMTGCSVEYDLIITPEKISEKIIALDMMGDLSESEATNIINNLVDANMGEGGILDNGYGLKQIINDENYGLEVSLDDVSKYSLDFKNNCFEKFIIEKKDDYYELKTSGKFNCLNVWNNEYTVLVNISIDGEILESNAEQIKGNHLLWTISRENGNELFAKYRFLEKKKSNVINYIIIGIIVLLIGFVVLYIVQRNKKENEI